MPAVLMQLMRHASIHTTMAYYVTGNAQETADLLYESVSGDTSGDTRHSGEKRGDQQKTEAFDT
jgi:hypothetical protein